MTSEATSVAGGTTALFRASTPWSPWAAVLATIGVIFLAMTAAAVMGSIYLSLTSAAEQYGGPSAVTRANAMAAMVVMQSVMIALIWWMAGWHGASRDAVLSLRGKVTRNQLLLGLGGMVALLAPYNAAIYLLWPSEFTRDLRMFSELARSEVAWIAGIVVAIGAPLSEELMFRGFLLPALARSRAATVLTIAAIIILTAIVALLVLELRLGRGVVFVVAGIGLALYMAAWRLDARPAATPLAAAGEPASSLSASTPLQTSERSTAFLPAALFTTLMWTAMHVGYSATGLIEVFMIGLYFCWLMWRFGNLWLTIWLHAIYNGLQFLVLTQVALPTPA